MNNQLFQPVKDLNLPMGKYALFGSSPLGIRGIRESRDIDIIVTEELWNEYKSKGWEVVTCPDGIHFLLQDGIELWKVWKPGVWDIQALINDAEIIDGLPYVRLEKVLEWKKISGRDKDLKDVDLIKKFLEGESLDKSRKLYTITIVHQADKILLGMKKRGFGEGRWNGFGGKVLPEEGIVEAAKRELEEEAGIKAEALDELGVVDFEFSGKPGILEVHIFKAREYSGEIRETEEMRPQWFNVNEIPFNEMWSDDIYWMPLFLEDKKFKAKFLFDENDQVIEKEVIVNV